jgi:hypothetical protein
LGEARTVGFCSGQFIPEDLGWGNSVLDERVELKGQILIVRADTSIPAANLRADGC